MKTSEESLGTKTHYLKGFSAPNVHSGKRTEGGSKGFLIVIILLKRGKITKKYFCSCKQTINILTPLLSGNTLRVVVTS